MFRACHAFLSVHCSHGITCWERASLLAILYVVFSCVFVTFTCGVLGQVWFSIESIPYLSLLTYFVRVTPLLFKVIVRALFGYKVKYGIFVTPFLFLTK